jgi:hypothetical protein
MKDRFLDSISDEGERFRQVESEFDDVERRREQASAATRELGDGAVANHERRVQSVVGARNEFLSTIDDFLADREKTAETIRSLQTQVPGVSGAATVQMPFWVVGIERDGGEEVRVLPVQERGDPNGAPTRGAPYADYLQTHPTHGLEDTVDAVHEYVTRDEVRDALAERDGPFADPTFLADAGVARERFVETLREYEFDGERETTGGDTVREETNGEAGATEDRERREAVTTDD